MSAAELEKPAELASALMKQGIALLNQNTAESLAESLQLFDRALALRRALPPSEDPWAAHVLAASWMNRGDALTRLATPEHLAEALHSYDEALAVLRGIPLDANPLFRRRFAIAWMNRGITLQEQGTAESLAEALRSFDEGIAALSHVADQAGLVACGWMNRANVCLRLAPPRLTGARTAALTALSLVREWEMEDPIAAETGLKARYILCQAIAQLLAPDAPHFQELVAESLDAVGRGLEIARHWEQRGETGFRPLVSGLFQFGAMLHQKHQPDALSAFLRENLAFGEAAGATAEGIAMYTAAAGALAHAWLELQAEGFSAVNTPRFDRWLETLRALRLTETRLRELRRSL